MKVKTSELTGPALDWAVGDIEFSRLIEQESYVKSWVLEAHRLGQRTNPYSIDWLFGGPIIERELIDIAACRDANGWEAITLGDGDEDGYQPEHLARGPTPLIAAMRCFVASHLGDEVEIPEGLA